MRTGRALLIGVALSATTVAAQQPVPSAPAPPRAQEEHSEIVVRARREQIIRDFVAALADPTRTGQLPLWETPLCPRVVGLSPDHARFVADRMAAAAMMAGLRSATSRCQPTVYIVFSPDAARLAKRYADRFRISLSDDGSWRVDRFERTTRPVRWISITGVGAFTGESIDLNSVASNPGHDTRIGTSTRATTLFMLVIVDTKQVAGRRIGPIADYLSMVALVRPPLDKPAPGGSVLKLFDDEPQLAGLTANDRAYIRGLYATSDGQSLSIQRATIVNVMRRGHDEP